MKIRILSDVAPKFRIRIYIKKKTNRQKLSIQKYENLEFRTVHEEFVCALRIA